MLLFGHIGITTGVVKAYDILASMTKPGSKYQPGSSLKISTVISKKLRLHYLLNGAKGRIDSMDYRMVLVGSLLPDIIDKPLWFFTAAESPFNGRGYTHGLLLNLALFIGGLVLIRYRKSWLLLISLSSFIHLIFDRMWNSPAVLLWPLLGPFPREEKIGWLSNIFQVLFSQPDVYIPEIIGLAIVLLFAYRVVMRKSITSFVKSGAIE